jgi:hypothetical protein
MTDKEAMDELYALSALSLQMEDKIARLNQNYEGELFSGAQLDDLQDSIQSLTGDIQTTIDEVEEPEQPE